MKSVIWIRVGQSRKTKTWLMRSFAAEETIGFEGNFKSTCTILQKKRRGDSTKLPIFNINDKSNTLDDPNSWDVKLQNSILVTSKWQQSQPVYYPSKYATLSWQENKRKWIEGHQEREVIQLKGSWRNHDSHLFSLLTFCMCLNVPLLQMEGHHKETHSTGHQDSKCPHLRRAPHSPL